MAFASFLSPYYVAAAAAAAGLPPAPPLSLPMFATSSTAASPAYASRQPGAAATTPTGAAAASSPAATSPAHSPRQLFAYPLHHQSSAAKRAAAAAAVAAAAARLPHSDRPPAKRSRPAPVAAAFEPASDDECGLSDHDSHSTASSGAGDTPVRRPKMALVDLLASSIGAGAFALPLGRLSPGPADHQHQQHNAAAHASRKPQTSDAVVAAAASSSQSQQQQQQQQPMRQHVDDAESDAEVDSITAGGLSPVASPASLPATAAELISSAPAISMAAEVPRRLSCDASEPGSLSDAVASPGAGPQPQQPAGSSTAGPEPAANQTSSAEPAKAVDNTLFAFADYEQPQSWHKAMQDRSEAMSQFLTLRRGRRASRHVGGQRRPSCKADSPAENHSSVDSEDAEGESGAVDTSCPQCGKSYRQNNSFYKHLFEHHPQWQHLSETLKVSKHQQVMMMQGAELLMSLSHPRSHGLYPLVRF